MTRHDLCALIVQLRHNADVMMRILARLQARRPLGMHAGPVHDQLRCTGVSLSDLVFYDKPLASVDYLHKSSDLMASSTLHVVCGTRA